MPFRSASYHTNHDIECIFCTEAHKIKQQLRKCTHSKFIINHIGEKIKKICPTKYKVQVCPIWKEKIIAYIVDHEHDEDEEGDVHASDPIDLRIKDVVHSILQTNPEIKPKRVRVLLNTNRANYPSIVDLIPYVIC